MASGGALAPELPLAARVTFVLGAYQLLFFSKTRTDEVHPMRTCTMCDCVCMCFCLSKASCNSASDRRSVDPKEEIVDTPDKCSHGVMCCRKRLSP